MAEGKKVSFGFTKSVKKSVLKNVEPEEKKKVDYIECVDDKSIKVIGGEEKKDETFVIPVLRNTWHDRIRNKIDVDIYNPKKKSNVNIEGIEKNINEEPHGDVLDITGLTDVEIKIKGENEKPLETLEEQAAKEILNDLVLNKPETEDARSIIPLVTLSSSLQGQEESILTDYDELPVERFGIAMLRGMGWQPNKGIGKIEKVVMPTIPELRPKGMGLGADKVAWKQQNGIPKIEEEEKLKLVKGAFVKLTTGRYANNYGQIEALDDFDGRLVIKMALGGEVISIPELSVQLVTTREYSKNSKVLNATKYEKYKNKDTNNGVPSIIIKSSDTEKDSTDDLQKVDDKNRRSDKKKVKYKRYSSDENSRADRRLQKRRGSNDSSMDCRSKKSKKLKKHKRHGSTSRKNKHKNKKRKKEVRSTRDSVSSN